MSMRWRAAIAMEVASAFPCHDYDATHQIMTRNSFWEHVVRYL
jgi:hypothetical protein